MIFGHASGFADIDLAAPLTAAQGFRIFGADAGDQSGCSVSSAGDVNGDGFDDLIVGARGGDASGNARTNAGESAVIFGQASGFADIDLRDADGRPGLPHLRRRWYTTSRAISVSSAGDVNGDGFDDLIVGAFLGDASGNAKTDAGDSTVIFGHASGFADIDLAAPLTAAQGFRIFGADAYDQSGRSVSSAGDVNGDGFDDLIVGSSTGRCGRQRQALRGREHRDLRQGLGLCRHRPVRAADGRPGLPHLRRRRRRPVGLVGVVGRRRQRRRLRRPDRRGLWRRRVRQRQDRRGRELS